MTAPLTAPVEGPSVDLCPLCRTAITDDLSETLSKRVVMMVIPPGGVVYVHTRCALNAHAARAETHRPCGRCGLPKAGPHRQHGIDEENVAICGDGFATTDPRPFVDPYALPVSSEAA